MTYKELAEMSVDDLDRLDRAMGAWDEAEQRFLQRRREERKS